MFKKIAVGCDHAAFSYKEKLVPYLRNAGFEVVDVGTDSEASVDYPVFAAAVCEKVISKEADCGILMCGTGIGMSMAANKFNQIRAALCTDTTMAEFTRRHNNANVLCMGARIIPYETVLKITDIFLSTEFDGGRHQKRIDLFSSEI